MDIETINSVCIGWSTENHVQFFTEILSDQRINNVCVCGVYHGRDIAYIKYLALTLYNRDITIVGVDLFSDEPGTDWAENKRHMTWQQFCGMPNPTIEKAQSNLELLNLNNKVTLIKNRDAIFLDSTNEKFDFIYLDTAHDYDTVKTSIDKSIHKLSNIGLIGGDDFSDAGTWGVASAVKKSFSQHGLLGSCWYANAKDYIK